MIVNPEKHQAMVLGTNSSYEFSFPVKNSIDLLGVTVDKDLSFNRHLLTSLWDVTIKAQILVKSYTQ